ncbi:uncharacterized protein EDB93DRAFT_1338745 [Suillus bovinus]|uniref:uncharacterized protein n=1 Tax=Suillus bovinus TaxID=48563 RepID=UPI001B87F12C|nr:uncharacterized protein EDB93DRAFT_1338745 [Suillus bovinus]KAG2140488.1 hypothetical protein EDB93DRAFT_1338745 [Suillus bovinus]
MHFSLFAIVVALTAPICAVNLAGQMGSAALNGVTTLLGDGLSVRIVTLAEFTVRSPGVGFKDFRGTVTLRSGRESGSSSERSVVTNKRIDDACQQVMIQP